MNPINNPAEIAKQREQYERELEKNREQEINTRIYNALNEYRAQKNHNIATQEREKYLDSLRKSTPGHREMRDFNRKSKAASVGLPLASISSFPYMSKKYLIESGAINEKSNIGRMLYGPSYQMDSLNYLARNGLHTPGTGAASNAITGMMDLSRIAAPMTAGLSMGLTGARQSKLYRSYFQDRDKLGKTASSAAKFGVAGQLISNAMLSPMMLKAGRQLPFIGGAMGGLGDLGTAATMKLTRSIGNVLTGTNSIAAPIGGLSTAGIHGLAGTGLSTAAKAAGSGAVGTAAGAVAGKGAEVAVGTLTQPIIGALTLAIPSIISAVQGIRTETARRRLVAVRQSPFQFVREYSQTHIVDNILPRLINLRQISPSDQLKIILLKMIADSVSPIPKMTEILDYMEQQREKELNQSKKTSNTVFKRPSEKTIGSVIGRYFDVLALGAQKFTNAMPFTQLMTYIFERKTPHDIKNELDDLKDSIFHEDKRKKEIEKLSRQTGLSYEFITLLNTPLNALLKRTTGPESTQITLLGGIYELMRGYVSTWMGDRSDQKSLKVSKPPTKRHNFLDILDVDNIPGLSGIVDISKFIYNLDSTQFLKNIFTKGVSGAGKEWVDTKKEKWGGRFNKYIKDPIKEWSLGGLQDYQGEEGRNLVLKDLELFKSQDEKIKQYQETGLPDDIQTIIFYLKEQLNTLENSFEVNKILLQKLAGEDYSKQRVVENKEMKFDFISGKSVNKDEFEKLKGDRKKLADDKFQKLSEGEEDYSKESLLKLLKEVAKGGGSALLLSSLFGLSPMAILLLTGIASAWSAGDAGLDILSEAPTGNKMSLFHRIFKKGSMTKPADPDELKGVSDQDNIIDKLFSKQSFDKDQPITPISSTTTTSISNNNFSKIQKEILQQLKIIDGHITFYGDTLDNLEYLLNLESININLISLIGSQASLIDKLDKIQEFGTEYLKKISENTLNISTSISEFISSGSNRPTSPSGILNPEDEPLPPSTLFKKPIADDYHSDNLPPNVFSLDAHKKKKEKQLDIDPTNSPSAFHEYRAKGGPVESGKSYIVGEESPEMFVPNRSGKILNAADILNALFSFFKKGINKNRNTTQELSEIEEKKKEEEQEKFQDAIVDEKKGYLSKITDLLTDISKKSIMGLNNKVKEDSGISTLISVLTAFMKSPIVAGITGIIGLLGGKFLANKLTSNISELKGEDPNNPSSTTNFQSKTAGNVAVLAGKNASSLTIKGGEKLVEKGSKFAIEEGAKNAVKGIGLKGAGAATKFAGKTVSKMIPWASAGIGASFAADRYLKGDTFGAVGEMAAGIAGSFPGIGTAISFGISAGLLAYDSSRENSALSELKKEMSSDASDLIGDDIDKFKDFRKLGIIIYDEKTKKWVLDYEAKNKLDPKTLKDYEERKKERESFERYGDAFTDPEGWAERERNRENKPHIPRPTISENLYGLMSNSTENLFDDFRMSKESPVEKPKESSEIVSNMKPGPKDSRRPEYTKLYDPNKSSKPGSKIMNTIGTWTGASPEKVEQTLDDYKQRTGLNTAIPKFTSTVDKTIDNTVDFGKKAITSGPVKDFVSGGLDIAGKGIATGLNAASSLPDVAKKIWTEPIDEKSPSPVKSATGSLIKSNVKTNLKGALPAELHPDEAVIPLNDPEAKKYIFDAFKSTILQSLDYNYGKLNSNILKTIDKNLSPENEEEKSQTIRKEFNTINIPRKSEKSTNSNTSNIITPTFNNANNIVGPKSDRFIGSSERINNIIDQIFPNSILSFELAIKSFALGQSPFSVVR